MKTALFALAVSGLAITGCGKTTEPNSEAAASTSWPGETWQISTPVAEGFDPAPIDAFIADIEVGKYDLVDHLLIIRHGRVVVDQSFSQDYGAVSAALEPDQKVGLNRTDEQYNYEDPNWHPFYKGTALHSMQSITKSVTSAAIGVALDEGLIESVDVPILGYFDAYEFDRSDPRKAKITLEDLLTMRSGIDWVTEGSFSDPNHSTVGLEASTNWIQFVLDRPMDQLPGTVWEYNDGASVLIGKILREATGERVEDWARDKLFGPLGITDFYWKTTPDGETDTEGGLFLKAHDLARIGHLFVNDGEWNGKQVLSADWIAASVKPHIADVSPSNDGRNSGYSYQWWVPEHENGEAKVYGGIGFGGQRLIVVPEHNIVAVLTGWNIFGNPEPVEVALREQVIPDALSR